MVISHPYKNKTIVLSRSELWKLSHDCVVNKKPTVHLVNVFEVLHNELGISRLPPSNVTGFFRMFPISRLENQCGWNDSPPIS